MHIRTIIYLFISASSNTMPKEARRNFVVQSIDDVRSRNSPNSPGREYLTRWRGYKTPSWNREEDFPVSFFDVLLLQDFLAIAKPDQELKEGAKLLLNLKK